jgi:arsenite methyltransferase
MSEKLAAVTEETPVDADALREDVKDKYREVAVDPHGEYHFHTGRPLARRLGYDPPDFDDLPDAAIESFAGVGNPFSLHPLAEGERVVDMGSGGGFDCFVAAEKVGASGRVVGVDMTEEMLEKSRSTARQMGFDHVEFREGLLEDLPVDDGWADVVISNGVINLCADKKRIFSEIMRALRPGGRLQFADIANGKPVPESAIANIDLWTA